MLFRSDGGRRQLVGEHLRVDFGPQLQQEVEAILGSGCVQLTDGGMRRQA